MPRDPRVDAYLAALPDDQRRLLEHLRAQVERLAPEAVETISYRLPTFKVDGRLLLSYAAWKGHCSIYPFGGAFDDALAAKLQPFRGSKGSLHFTPRQPFPDALLAAYVRARLAALQRPA